MARLKLAKKNRLGGRRLVAALAGFAILCGLILLAGGADLSCGVSQQQIAAKNVLSALKSTQRADRALESGNYGTARSHVQAASESLTEALGQLRVNIEAP